MRRCTALLSVAVLPLAAAVALATPAAADTSGSAPTVRSVAPYLVPVSGGAVTIRGTGFITGSTVAIGSSPATAVSVVSGTEITAMALAHSRGPAEVVVTTANGESPSSRADVVAYQAAPTVLSDAPIAGPVAGGTGVTITGHDFDGVTQVLFGSTPARRFRQVSPSVITAVAPAHAAGRVVIHVVTGAGSSADPQLYPPNDRYTFGGLSLRADAVLVPRGHRAKTTHVAQIACPAVGTCFAAGSYLDATTGITRPLLERIVQGTPTAVGTGEQSGIEAGKLVQIACPSVTRCYAIGEVLNTHASRWSTLLLTLTGGVWHLVRAAAGVDWDHLSCRSATDCTASGRTAVGRATTGSGWPVFLRIHDRTSTLERGAALRTTPLGDDGVTCSSATDCVQWGQYGAKGHSSAYVQVRHGSSWRAFTVAVKDTSGNPVKAVELASVFCTSAAHCLARGSYDRVNPDDANFDIFVPIAVPITTRPGTVSYTQITYEQSSTGYPFGALAPMQCQSSTSCYTIDRGVGATASDSFQFLDVDLWRTVKLSGSQNHTEVHDLSCTATPSCLLTGSEDQSSPAPNPSAPVAFYGRTGRYTSYDLPEIGTGPITASAGVVGCVKDGYCAVAVTAGTGANASDYLVTTSSITLPGSGPTPPAAPSGPAPTITSVAPFQLSAQRGGQVTIAGTHFDATSSVTFGGVAAGGVHVTSATSLTVTAPTTAGTFLTDVRVSTTSGGTSVPVAADVVRYRAAPSVAAISSVGGPSAGGTAITITGTDFDDLTGVTFGGVPATSVTEVSPTKLTAVTPPHAAGPTDFDVTTAWGTSGTNTFYYGTDLAGVRITFSDVALPPGVQRDDQFLYHLACGGRGECYSNGAVQPRRGDYHGFFDQSSDASWSSAATDGDPAVIPSTGPIACSGPGDCHTVAGNKVVDLANGAWTSHPLAVNLSWQGLACPTTQGCVGYGQSSNTSQWPTFATITGDTAVSVPGGSIAGGTWDPDPAAGDLPDPGAQHLVCPKLDSCVQWGTYKDADGNDLAYAQTAVGSSWVIRTVPIPGGAAATKSEILAVTCAKAGECVGYGDYSTDGTTFHEMKVTLTGGRLSSVDVSTDPTATKALAGAALTSISCSSEDNCDGIATLPAADPSQPSRGALLARLVDNTWVGTVASNPSAGVYYNGVSCPQDGYCVVSGITYQTEPGGYPDPEAEVTFDIGGQITAVPTHVHQSDGSAIVCATGTRTCTIASGRTSPTSFSASHIDITG